MTKTKIYGHRGSKGSFPENTLIGFEEAIKQGIDGLELDVHLTKDNQIVVIHDEFLDRTTDGTGYIKDYCLQEIKQFSAGIKFSHFQKYDDTWQLERVPTLQEVLDLLIPYDIELNIELKTYLINYEGIEEKVLSLVKEYGSDRKVIYSSFHLPTVLRIKQLDQTANIAWLIKQHISHPNDYMQSLELEGLHLSKSIVLSGANHWKNMYRNVRVWTVNDSDEIKQLLDLNVDTIITDFPAEALRIKNERKSFI